MRVRKAMSSDQRWQVLEQLLEQRLAVIADHAWRDRDAVGHLAALQSVSEQLLAEHERLRGVVPARLNHYLTQASFSKALEWIRSDGATG